MKQKKSKDLFGKKQIFVITADPYKQECVVIVNGKFQDAIDFFKKLKSKNAKRNLEYLQENTNDYTGETRESTQATLFTGLPFGYIMNVNHQNSWIETVENVAHESLHLTHYVLLGAGITLSKESEETFTYLQGHIITQILDKMYG